MPTNRSSHRGIHLVVDALKLNDVKTIYGVVGIPITDLARLAQASGIRYIGFRHESDAGHAAAAAGFLTQKPGICLTVSAPGFLNGLVALANATTNCFPDGADLRVQRTPLVDLQRGDYEEMDQLAAARTLRQGGLPGIARRGHRPRHRPRHPHRRIRPSRRGLPRHPGRGARRGARRREGVEDAVEGRQPGPKQLPEIETVDSAIELLAGAERPLIVLGKGAAYAQADEQIREFVETTGMPVRADVDGQGPAARRPSAVRGHRPLAGAEAGRRGACSSVRG